MYDCLTLNSFFVQEKCQWWKEAHINVLNSAHSRITWLIFLRKLIITSINFPNYQNFNDDTVAYDDWIQKIMVAIDKVAPIKGNFEAIKNCDKLLKKNLDYILIRNYIMQLSIRYISWFSIRKKIILKIKLNECIGKPKESRKALKSLGLPNKTSSCEVSAVKFNKTVQHDTNLVLGGFKDYYSNIARNRLKKLPKPPNEFILNNIFQHYKSIIQNDFFNLATVSENTFLTFFKILKYLLDNLSGRFLKDGAKVLAKPFTDLCNLSITFRKIFWLL